MQLKKLLFGQQPIWSGSLLPLRVWAGVIFIFYGKSVFQLNSMHDFAQYLQEINIPFPVVNAWLCKTSEFLGGTFLIIGFLKRPACLFLIVDMTVATFVAGNGELLRNGRTPFILLICCLTILLSSQDKLSLDWYLFKKVI